MLNTISNSCVYNVIMTFADKIKFLRNRDGLTQIALASKINVAPGTIGMIESGARLPSKEISIRLANLFSVPVEVFLVENFDIPEGATVPRTIVDPELLIDIMDAITEFLAENNLEMTREQRKELIKHFCANGLNDAQRIKDVLSGMLAAGSNLFVKKSR